MAALAQLDAAAAGTRGQVKITAVRAMRLDDGFCLVRVDTDAGISGYGECGAVDGDMARAELLAVKPYRSISKLEAEIIADRLARAIAELKGEQVHYPALEAENAPAAE